MTLEQEAKEKSVEWSTSLDEQHHFFHGFHYGANSKFVQIEKIKAQIEILSDIIENRQDFFNIDELIQSYQKELEQQLKQLEQ